ncbi:hypothetical protein [Nocardia xishanensis]
MSYQMGDPRIRSILKVAAAKLAERTLEIVDDTVEQLLARNLTNFRPGRSAFDSMESNLRAAFSRLEHGTTGVGAPPAALIVARDLAIAGLDDKTILDLYHVGHALIWERWVLPALAAECEEASTLVQCAQVAHHDMFDWKPRSTSRSTTSSMPPSPCNNRCRTRSSTGSCGAGRRVASSP